MAMTLYEETLGPLAKRARLDYSNGLDRLGYPFLLPPQLVEIQLAKKPNDEHPNHVLLFTVLNPLHNITCDVLHTIASPFGKVLRIVIFKKNGVQAMVEFENVESAQRAKDNLHGCDIYSGCCTLKIEYAKPVKLNVYKNDSDSYDYTNPGLGKNLLEQACVAVASAPANRPVLLKDPMMAAGEPSIGPLAVAIRPHQLYPGPAAQVAVSLAAAPPLNFGPLLTPALPGPGHLIAQQAGATTGHAQPAQAQPAAQTQQQQAAQAQQHPQQQPQQPVSPCALVSSQPGPLVSPGVVTAMAAAVHHPQGCVTMVYGLNCQKMNCARVFSLFCLYGNVVRVKFLKTKEGCAMVQMGDNLAVERAVTNLNNVTFFGSKMQLGFSKQAFLADVQQPFQLPDGSPSFMDYMGNKNNRFINPEMASKNRIQPPSKILHFFNTPPGLDAKDIEDIFSRQGTPKPKCVKLFPSKTERSSSGLIEFDTLSQSLEALVMANHAPVENPTGKFPYIMKLCFSSSKAIPAVIH